MGNFLRVLYNQFSLLSLQFLLYHYSRVFLLSMKFLVYQFFIQSQHFLHFLLKLKCLHCQRLIILEFL